MQGERLYWPFVEFEVKPTATPRHFIGECQGIGYFYTGVKRAEVQFGAVGANKVLSL